MSGSATAKARRSGLSPTQKIFIGLFIGVVAGIWIGRQAPDTAVQIVSYVKPFSELFLRLIKMIIAPLIFATLVAGIAGAGHFKVVGRMGLRAIVYFEIVTTTALLIGLVAVNLVKPGVGIALPAEAATTTAAPQTWDQILLHAVPVSVIDAMAKGDVHDALSRWPRSSWRRPPAWN